MRAVLAMTDSTVRMNLIIQEQCLCLIKLSPSPYKQIQIFSSIHIFIAGVMH